MAFRQAGIGDGGDLEVDWEVTVFFRADKTTQAASDPARRAWRMPPREDRLSWIGAIALLIAVSEPGLTLFQSHIPPRLHHITLIGDLAFHAPEILALIAVVEAVSARLNIARLFKRPGFRETRRDFDGGSALIGILFFVIPRANRDHLRGDLEEEYRYYIAPVRNWFHARCWWWRQVFGIVGRYAWKRVRRVLGVEVVRGWRRR